jgi:hypothetical protein
MNMQTDATCTLTTGIHSRLTHISKTLPAKVRSGCILILSSSMQRNVAEGPAVARHHRPHSVLLNHRVSQAYVYLHAVTGACERFPVIYASLRIYACMHE